MIKLLARRVGSASEGLLACVPIIGNVRPISECGGLQQYTSRIFYAANNINMTPFDVGNQFEIIRELESISRSIDSRVIFQKDRTFRDALLSRSPSIITVQY